MQRREGQKYLRSKNQVVQGFEGELVQGCGESNKKKVEEIKVKVSSQVCMFMFMFMFMLEKFFSDHYCPLCTIINTSLH